MFTMLCNKGIVRRWHPAGCPQKQANILTRHNVRTSAVAGTRSAINNTPAIVQQKLALLEKISTLNRGALASSMDKFEVETLVKPLEQARGMMPFEGQPPAIDGKWQLVYSSVEAFRSSPFFWAFQEGLVQDRGIASAIFKFTDSIPGADIGPAYQTISLASGSLVSEVELTVFPGVSGYVVTSSRLSAASDTDMELVIESTRVANSNLLPQLFDAVSVPVEQIMAQIRGKDAAKVQARVVYMDSQLRVTRTLPDNQLFIYRRVL